MDFPAYRASLASRNTPPDRIPIFAHVHSGEPIFARVNSGQRGIAEKDLMCAPLNYHFPEPPRGYFILSEMLHYAKEGFVYIPHSEIGWKSGFIIISRYRIDIVPPYTVHLATCFMNKVICYESYMFILRQLFAALETPLVKQGQGDMQHLKVAIERYAHQLVNAEITHRRQCKAARVIQAYWKFANSNPYHPVCQRRLMREYDSMTIP